MRRSRRPSRRPDDRSRPGIRDRPMNRIAPVGLWRSRNTNGWSARNVGGSDGNAADSPTTTPVAAAAFRPLLVHVHARLVHDGGDREVARAVHAGEVGAVRDRERHPIADSVGPSPKLDSTEALRGVRNATLSVGLHAPNRPARAVSSGASSSSAAGSRRRRSSRRPRGRRPVGAQSNPTRSRVRSLHSDVFFQSRR